MLSSFSTLNSLLSIIVSDLCVSSRIYRKRRRYNPSKLNPTHNNDIDDISLIGILVKYFKRINQRNFRKLSVIQTKTEKAFKNTNKMQIKYEEGVNITSKKLQIRH